MARELAVRGALTVPASGQPVVQQWPWLRPWVVLVVGAVLVGSVHAATPTGISVTDDRGRSQTFERPPERIVSLLPSLTETVCTLGACQRLVGVDRHSNQPREVLALPKLGGLDDLAVEALLRLKPDVVLAARSLRAVDRLEALGLKVLTLEAQTHADVKRSLYTVATLLGRPDDGVQAWLAIERGLQAAAAQVPTPWRGRSVYVEVASTPFAAGRSSFIGETLTALGLANIVPAEMGIFPQLNPEFILRAQPDLIVITAREAAALPRRPGWQRLRAVQGNRVCGLPTAEWDTLVRPGPNLPAGARAVVACLARQPALP
jgi:iron complex transport system substrate-binding protein